MKRYKLLILISALFICSIGAFFLISKIYSWSYTFIGTSHHWEGLFVVRPSKDGREVVYEGTIKLLKPIKINELVFKADLVTDRIRGRKSSPNIVVGKPKQLFLTGPGHSSIKFLGGMTLEELTQIFYRDPVYELTWNDETGQHSETIVLKLGPSD